MFSEGNCRVDQLPRLLPASPPPCQDASYLVIRLFLNGPLTPVNQETLYGGAEQGYTDYPTLRTVAHHACFSDVREAWG
jgi:hypothetical protein